MFSGFGMSTFGLTAGLVCAAAIFLFFSQLDRAAVAAQELPPTDELRALSRKRQGPGSRMINKQIPTVVIRFIPPGRPISSGLPPRSRLSVMS